MKQILFYICAISILTAGLRSPLCAKGAGTSAGLTLMRTSGARPSALGDAFTAMTDDIRALQFNPGSLGTLGKEHVSLQYQTGLANDAYSQALLGWRLPKGALGFSLGQYDSGKVQLYDGVNSISSVTAEKDMAVNVGYGALWGKTAWGTNVRYLSSHLAESYSGSAYSVEAGVQMPIMKQLRFGLSGPLVQTDLQYADVKENLPKIYRAGFMANVNLNLASGRQPLTLLLDVPYDAAARKVALAGGIETHFGPLALRMGSSGGMDVKNFSFGAGFTFARYTIDYTFGLLENGFDSMHNINFSMRFGNDRPAAEVRAQQLSPGAQGVGNSNTASASAAAGALAENTSYEPVDSAYFTAVEKSNNAKGKTYIVKEGDTLKSISMKFYGDESWAPLIFYDNKDALGSADRLNAGAHIILP